MLQALLDTLSTHGSKKDVCERVKFRSYQQKNTKENKLQAADHSRVQTSDTVVKRSSVPVTGALICSSAVYLVQYRARTHPFLIKPCGARWPALRLKLMYGDWNPFSITADELSRRHRRKRLQLGVFFA
jgi:hypothetical protein